MTFTKTLQLRSVGIISLMSLVACGGGGGGGGGSSSNPPMDPPAPPPPMQSTVDFGKTLSDLVTPDGSVTLPDGRSYDADSAPIEMSDYIWDIDNTDDDQTVLDDVFSS